MYVPKPYLETRREVLCAAIESASFGALITVNNGQLNVSHVPFALSSDPNSQLWLACHIARANPQWEGLEPGASAVATWILDEAYISPSFYPSKAEHGRVVPTWNYVAVEARGTLEVVHEAEALLAIVEEVTRLHERHHPVPWSAADAPASFTAGLLRTIVGLRMRVTSLTGAWKLDQKKNEADRLGAAAGLAANPATASMAARMRAV